MFTSVTDFRAVILHNVKAGLFFNIRAEKFVGSYDVSSDVVLRVCLGTTTVFVFFRFSSYHAVVTKTKTKTSKLLLTASTIETREFC